MQNQLCGSLSEKTKSNLSKEKEIKLQSKTALMSKIKNFDPQPAKNLIDMDFARKMNELQNSITNARKELLKFKKYLSEEVSLENDCLTPLAQSNNNPMLFYKREDLTAIKAYKIRGAFYQMSEIKKRVSIEKADFIAASTGNHALGVLKAAEILKLSNVTICISKSVTDFKKQQLKKKIANLQSKGVNAKLFIEGDNFDDTNKFAKNLVASSEYNFYIDPYNTHNAVAGQGTIGLEIISQLERKLLCSKDDKFSNLEEITVVVPIGGGGLISGIACALKSGFKNSALLEKYKVRVVGVELETLNSLYGDAIKVETTGSHNKQYIEHLVNSKVKINDADMKRGINFVYNDLGAKVEGASAGTLKPILEGTFAPCKKNAVICVLSGGNINF